VNGVLYPKGSFVISLAQPKMGLIRNLLGETHYADNEWTRARDGSPLRPYDSAMHVMSEIMGVRVDPVDRAVADGLIKVTGRISPAGRVAAGASEYVIDGRLNAAYRAVNRLLDKKVSLRRVDRASGELRPGDFIVSGEASEALAEAARVTGVDFTALENPPATGVHPVRRMRVGMYQRYFGGNMDEGWTRLLLEKFDFPYQTIMDADIKAGGLIRRFDVIILPDDSPEMMMGEVPARYRRYLSAFPPEYISGMGSDGLSAIKDFVSQGGSLVTLGEASMFAIEKLGLSVRNAMAGLPSRAFFCPGSTIRASFDNTHPLAYGMPDQGLALYWSSPAFEIIPGSNNEDYRTIVRYADRDLLQSGWLIGEEHLSEKTAMLSARFGKGEVVLIGFRTQNRCQTHGTFKLLFNALIR